MINKHGIHCDPSVGDLLIILDENGGSSVVRIEAMIDENLPAEKRAYLVSDKYNRTRPNKIVYQDILNVAVGAEAKAIKERLGFDKLYGLCPLCYEPKLHPDDAMNPLSRNIQDLYICTDCGKKEAADRL